MRKKLLRILRYTVQIISLVFFVFLIANIVYPLEWQGNALKWFTRTDPWGMFNFLRWNEFFLPDWFWLPVITMIITLVFGKVFCGWLCPFGALQMLADKTGRFILKNSRFKRIAVLRIKTSQTLRIVRYFWLAFLIVLFILESTVLISLTPFALLSGETVNIIRGTIPWMFIAVIIITLLFSRVWCSSVCPTGILLSAISKFRIFRYSISDSCTQCGKCAKACSVSAATCKPSVMEEGCLACGDCMGVCPESAVRFAGTKKKQAEKRKEDEPVNEEVKTGHTRREFIKISAAAVTAASIYSLGKTVKTTSKILRPPGALDEDIFTSVCSRCGRCIKVCPNEALVPMPISEGIECYGTPYIIPRQASCVLCLACQDVCPTGAIDRVPLENVRMGTASIDKKRCLSWSFDKLCFICGEQCPMLAIQPDEQIRPIVDTNICVGCGTCEKGCPAEGEAAIRVTPK